MSHVRTTSGSEDCPALPEGTGILPDGDFSRSDYPEKRALPTRKVTYSRPDWEVSKGNIDFNGSLGWGGEGLDNLCSVDLDGYYKVGGIKTSAFKTHKGALYTLSFTFSGNGGGPPTVKTMKVETVVISLQRSLGIFREATTYKTTTMRPRLGSLQVARNPQS